jgi:P pilus assembly/Cpx signaling pathway, periplasmic inhibitor/zinc-resistance associated protein
MKKLTLVLMVVGLGLLLSAPAFAFGGPRDDRGHGYCNEAGLQRLNLTDEQKTKIEALQIAHKKDVRPIREKMFDKSVALRRLWLQENPDKDKIYAAQKEVRTLRDKMEDKATALRFEIRKVLTPEQQEKLASFGGERGMGFGPRGGMRGHGEHGPGMGNCQ